MPIAIRCAGCGSEFKVADQFAGKRGKCPKCGSIIQIPAPSTPQTMKPLPSAGARDALLSGNFPAAGLPGEEMPAVGGGLGGAPLSPLRPKPQPKKAAIPPWVWVTASGGVALVILLLAFIFSGGGGRGQVAVVPPPPPVPVPSTTPAPPTTSTPSNLPTPPPPPAPSAAPVEPLPPRPKARVAKTLDDVTNAIVKFEMPIPGGMSAGTGFFIDDRGWIATNNHVASTISTAARVRLYNGEKIELEGIIAQVPERDLAIVKIKQLPPNFTILDISYQDRPKIGTTVYTYGHPQNQDFSLAKGIVSRVATTKELVSEQPNHLLTGINSPPDAIWIQTDATVLPGNSGGPLLDEKCRVLGINTFANLNARFGFASHVKYLKELVEKSSDQQLKPLPDPAQIKPPQQPGGQPPHPAISREKLQQLFDAAAAFNWQPTNPEQYKTLAELAFILTALQEPQAPQDLKAFGNELIGRIKQFAWNDVQINAINQFALSQFPPTGQQGGLVCVGIIRGQSSDQAGKKGLVLELPNFADLLNVVDVGDAAGAPPGSRVLVFGIVLPPSAQAQIPGQPQPRNIRIIKSGCLRPIA